jgi:hypothetical protein
MRLGSTLLRDWRTAAPATRPALPIGKSGVNRHTPLKSIRTNCIWRSVIVSVTLIGWFVLSNHCALGRMAQNAQTKAEHACCRNGDPKPAKQPADGEKGVQCCKSLHAVLPDAAKDAALTPASLVVAILAPLFGLEVQQADADVLANDTGPPARAETFTELVLHRSLRSHAPPFHA